MARSGRPDNSAGQISFFSETVVAEPVQVRKTTELGPNGKLIHRYPDGSKTTPEERVKMHNNPGTTSAATTESRPIVKGD
jgi:hypothetical protein